MESVERVRKVWSGRFGRHNSNRLHNPTAEARRVRPVEEGTKPPESQILREQSAVLLQFRKSKRSKNPNFLTTSLLPSWITKKPASISRWSGGTPWPTCRDTYRSGFTITTLLV